MQARAPKNTFSWIEIGSGFGRWNTIPTRCAELDQSDVGVVDVLPGEWIPPVMVTVGERSFIRLKQRSNVDFPQPDGSDERDDQPVGDVEVTFFSAWNLPYQRDRSRGRDDARRHPKSRST